jgi:hypothetical protein
MVSRGHDELVGSAGKTRTTLALQRFSGHRAALVATFLLGSAFLGLAAVHGADVAGSLVGNDRLARLDADAAAFACLDQQLGLQLPRGAAVFFVGKAGALTDAARWEQRALEGSYPRYHVRATRADASFVVTVEPVDRRCGVDVRVERTR